MKRSSKKSPARAAKKSASTSKKKPTPAKNTGTTTKELKLQLAMQRENQTYTAVSNIMKTKHDTAKNAIGNIR